MERIHVSRDRKVLGIFSAEEVAAGLKSGRFLASDLAWKEGMESWQPLATFTDLPVADDASSADPDTAPVLPTNPPVISGEAEPAWERREELGVGGAIYQTIVQVLTKPTDTFSRMKESGGLGSPLAYFLIIGVVVAFVSSIYQGILNTYSPSELFQSAPGRGVTTIWVGVAIAALLSPIYLTIAAFLGAGITHVCLMIAGGANRPFETTFRAVTYVTGSTQVLMMIPFCGGLLAWGWNIVALTIALRETHKIDTWRAVIAVLLPMIVCLGCIFTVIAASVAAFFQASGAPMTP